MQFLVTKRLTVTAFEQAPAPDGEGQLDWHYAGWSYCFDDGTRSLAARRYRDEPQVACILTEISGPDAADDGLLLDAVAYLVLKAGAASVQVLTDGVGYVHLDTARFLARHQAGRPRLTVEPIIGPPERTLR